jgi:ABC-type nitrate/sulfonate/bicarbonate transport system substrate-binding protein
MARRRFALSLALTTVLVLGCAQATPGSPGASSAASPGIDQASVIIGWNSTPDELYLPILMGVAAMQEQGYKIEARQLPETNLVIQAMTSNQVQFGAEGVPTSATAIQEGAPIKLISTQNANQVVWATLPEFADCKDLPPGEPIGIFSFEAGFTILTNVWMDRECPGVRETLEYVILQDSPLRAQALAEGQISGTALGLPDALNLQREYPDRFHYVYFAEALPGVGDEHFLANEVTLNDHPTIARALVREQLLAQRLLYDHPEQAMDHVRKHLPEVESDAVIMEFIKQRIWYANGGLRGPGLQNTLEGLDLPGDPEQMVAPDVLEDVLKEIGESDHTEF